MLPATNHQEDYYSFLQSKGLKILNYGKSIDLREINPILFDFQKDIVKWAIHKGRCAVFLDTGLGKTNIQLEWARMLGGTCLIIAPLSVAKQTIREGRKINIEVNYCRKAEQIKSGINITNYEMIDNFNQEGLDSVVLDESSILKSINSKTRQQLIKQFRNVKYKLCCSATPAPNDHTELGNHADFLDICSRNEMLSMFFINANKEHTHIVNDKFYIRKGSNKGGQEWRLKHHAEDRFFEWLSSWAIFMTTPSDLNYDGTQYILPPLNIIPKFIKVEDYKSPDTLFFMGLAGIQDRAKVRRNTVTYKNEVLRELIKQQGEKWIIWCGLDEEQREIEKVLSEGNISYTSVYGSLSAEEKEKRIELFLDNQVQILLSKPRVCGFGMNFQIANNMVFFGMNDSFESYYQAVRRCWRFGQKKPVNVYLVLSNLEEEIYRNVARKEQQSLRLRTKMIEKIKNYEIGELMEKTEDKEEYFEETIKEDDYALMKGDSCIRLKEIADNSIDLTVYSPPFLDLFVYSDSKRDLGNCRTKDEFLNNYRFVVKELLRITKEGRISCVHTSDIPAMANRDGYIGLKDFPGEVIRLHEEIGWIFVGRAYIDKNPQPLRSGTPIITPNGWVSIDDIKVGDIIIGKNGKPITVTDIPFRGNQPIYRITFDDGGFVDCGISHLWQVRTSNKNKWKIKTVKEMYEMGVKTNRNKYRWQIPVSSPIQYNASAVLPIHPRLLGAWLADGNWCGDRAIEITKDKILVESLPLPIGHTVVQRKNSERARGRTARYGIKGNMWHKNDVIDGLRQLGLKSCRAWEKFIPKDYLLSSITDRRELLSGLLNGDGQIKKKGGIYYKTTSAMLSDGIVEIVNSLGGLATARKKAGGKYKPNKQGRPIYEISIRMNGDWNPFTLERKAKRWKNTRRNIYRNIISIEKIEKEAFCICLSVDTEDGLFITKDFIVTHNSQAIRVKSKALLFVQMQKDSSHSRPALIDQVLIFKKPGENKIPIEPVKNNELDNETWISWAHGIWTDIKETETLQYYEARDIDDEKHICPLQIGTIERCIKLYSNPGETILTPFMGIGSEIYMAIKLNRKGVGIELKKSYFDMACKNVRSASQNKMSLFVNHPTTKVGGVSYVTRGQLVDRGA